MAEREEALEYLDESERRVKIWLKTHHSKNEYHGIQFISLQLDGGTMEMIIDFIFLGSKITADGDLAIKLKHTCTLEEKLWPT